MASKYYTGDYSNISINTDWGGDKSTGNLPLNGDYVQRIIKDTLNEKVGCVKTIGDLVYAFASEADYEMYLKYKGEGKDDKAEALVIDTWQGIRPNSIQLDMINPTGASQSFLYGTDEMPIVFSFDTVDQNFNHTVDERGTATVTVKKGLTTVGSVTKVIEQNTEVSIDLKSYLQIGSNEVSLTINGNSSDALLTRTFNFSVIQLTFVDDFDISLQRNPNEHETMEVPYYVTAPAANVTMEFIIDGNVDGKTTAILNSPAGNRQSQVINIAGLTEGVHTLQMCAKCLVGADIFATDIHYREFPVVTKTEAIPYLMVANTVPVELGTEPVYVQPGDAIIINNAMQYAALTINYAAFQYNIDTTKVGIYLNNVQQGSFQEVANNSPQTYKIYPEISGPSTLRLDVYNQDGTELVSSREISVDIADAQLNVQPITNNLVLQLRARGRTNEDANRNEWNDLAHGVRGVLKDFTWSETSGWDTKTNTLVIGQGNSVEIDYTPFANRNDILQYGLTFILEFTTENVANDEAMVCDMTDAGIGLGISASEVYYNFTDGNSAVSTRFKSGELYRIALVIDAQNTEQKSLIKLYVNGIISAVYHYNYESLQSITKKIRFIGSHEAEIRIKEIKVYKTAFVSDQIVNDYILSRDNLYDTRDAYGNLVDRGMLDLYNANNIYEEGSEYSDLGTVNYDTTAVANNIPIIFLTGRADKEDNPYHDTTTTYTSIHDLEGNNISKDPYIFVDVYYVNTQHPELNFFAERARLKIQGTSSVNYQKKNYKLSTNRKKYFTLVWQGKDCIEKRDAYHLADSNHQPIPDEIQPKDKGKVSFKKIWQEGDSETDSGVALRGEKAPQPVHTFVLKADCSDSSSAHNTGTARFWDQLFKKFTIKTAKGDERKGLTKSQKWAEDTGYERDVRTCVDGYPIVIFYREDENSKYEFIGKYNFNNDKGDEDVYGYGFTENPLYDSREQSWELLSSSDIFALGLGDMSKFDEYTENENHIVNYNWMGGFEARYPEQPDNLADTSGVNLIKQFVNQGGTRELKAFYVWLSSTRYDNEATSVHYGTADTISISSYAFPDRNETNIPNTPENRKKKFSAEKWDRFDIYKMAAYYVYLMRFGAVDQVVKNAIFATDGNEWNLMTRPCQWYYRNYDNDTILGSRNDGRLAYGPYIERKSASAEDSGSTIGGEEVQAYAYAGDRSIIWNQLTDDAEFMAIVQTVDNALVQAGLTYAQAIYFFNTLQSDKWCERIYNRDQIYKYISPFYSGKTLTKVDFPLLQGARMSHRKWWISKRFALYDSLYASGDYSNQVIRFKIADALQTDTNSVTGELLVPTLKMTVTPGANVYYGYSVKQAGDSAMVASWTGISPKVVDGKMQPMDFDLDTKQYVTIGNYINILAAESIAELDISGAIHRMATLELSNVYHPTKGTQLKVLKIGNTDKALALKNSSNPKDNAQYQMYIAVDSGLTNTSMNVSAAVMLEYLDMYGIKNVTDIDLSKLKFLQTFRGFASGLISLKFADGCPLTYLEVPASMTALNLSGLDKLTSKGIKFEEATTKIGALTIQNSQNLCKDYQFVYDWYAHKTVDDSKCRLDLEGIDWKLDKTGLVDNFIKLLSINDLTLKGLITVETLTQEQYNAIVKYFGTTDIFDFSKNTELKIRLTNASLFINIDEVAYEGNSIIVKPSIVSNSGFRLSSAAYVFEGGNITNSYGDTIKTDADGLNGVIHFNEKNTERRVSCVVSVTIIQEDGRANSINTLFELNVYKRIYPSNVNITVNTHTAFTSTDTIYYFTANVTPYITDPLMRGDFTYSWALTNNMGNFTSYAEIVSGVNESCCAIKVSDVHESRGLITVTIKYQTTNGETIPPGVISRTVDLIIKDPESVVSIYENPEVFEVFKNAPNIVTDDNRMTRTQAASVTNEQLIGLFRDNTNIKEFTQFPYFTNVTELPDECFKGCTNLKKINFVNELEENLRNSNLVKIGAYAFDGCTKLSELVIPNKVTTIGAYAFANCSGLKSLEFVPNAVGIPTMYLGSYACYNCTSLQHFAIGGQLTNTIPDGQTEPRWGYHVCDGCTGLTGFSFDATIAATEIPAYTFNNCKSLKTIELHKNIETIGESAFAHCESVGELTIPDTVTTIKQDAFAYLGAMINNCYPEHVYIGNGLIECHENAFRGVSPLNVHFDEDYKYNTINLFHRDWDGFAYDCMWIYIYRNLPILHYNLANYNNVYAFKVIDADLDIDDFKTMEPKDLPLGYFSCAGSLYYNDSLGLNLVRFYGGSDELSGYIYNRCPVHTDYKVFSYCKRADVYVPSNVLLTADNGFYGSKGNTITIDAALDNASGFFHYSTYNEYNIGSATTKYPYHLFNNIVLTGITIGPNVTSINNLGTSTPIYLLQRNEFDVSDLPKIHTFIEGGKVISPNQIYVMPDDYQYYSEKYAEIDPRIANIIKLYELPTEGYFNIISGNTWVDNAVITFGDSNVEVTRMYDGSYRFITESGNTNTTYTITIGDKTITGEFIPNVVNEIILDEINETGIDFNIDRGNIAYSVGNNSAESNFIVTSNIGNFRFNRQLSGLTHDNATSGTRQLKFKFPTLPIGTKITLNYVDYMIRGTDSFHVIYSITMGNDHYEIDYSNGGRAVPIEKTFTSTITEDCNELTIDINDPWPNRNDDSNALAYGLLLKYIQFNDDVIQFDYPHLSPALVNTENEYDDVNADGIIVDCITECYKLHLPETKQTVGENTPNIPSIEYLQEAFEIAREWKTDDGYLTNYTQEDGNIGIVSITYTNGELNENPDSGYYMDTERLDYNNRLSH